MWWRPSNNSDATATFLWRNLAAFTDRKLRRVAIRLNTLLDKLTVKQKKAFFGFFILIFSAAGIICVIPGVHILPINGIPPIQSSPPPVFPAEKGRSSHYSELDSIRAYSFSVMLDSMRRTEEGQKEIQSIEKEHPGLLDSMLQIINSLYPKK
ncbi:hypothetical protein [Filimonas effusa]|uniref:Uncharacterized protein n=1 Tax=Filimonas effusa TaxID=2508721 RepID=A0A4Q1D1E1_9BACT|nr:hypothetical protein [Filimonas effusa]RXK81665.1 hypothetical protein ESB13_17855 [Filimonas effusa]